MGNKWCSIWKLSPPTYHDISGFCVQKFAVVSISWTIQPFGIRPRSSGTGCAVCSTTCASWNTTPRMVPPTRCMVNQPMANCQNGTSTSISGSTIAQNT